MNTTIQDDADIDADLTDATNAAAMITAVDNAIKLVSTERGNWVRSRIDCPAQLLILIRWE